MISNVEKNLRAFISGLPDIQNVVSDPNCTGLVIGPRGDWSYEKLGRLRSDKAPLLSEAVDQLSKFLVSEINFCGEWIVHSHQGIQGHIIVFERRPTAVLERMSHRILRPLTESVRHQGDGLLIGPAGASKSSVLCWLAGQSTDEPLLLVSEVPPSSLPGKHVRHVFPPKNNERRSFERLVRISPVIFWDRIRCRDDLETMLLNTNASKRWFSVDIELQKQVGIATSFGTQIDYIVEWAKETNLNLKTIFSLSQSSIGRAEPQSLLNFIDNEWTESFRKDASFLKAFQKMDFVEEPSPERDAVQKMEERTRSFRNHTGIISEASLNVLIDSPNLPETTRQYASTDIISMNDDRTVTHRIDAAAIEPNLVEKDLQTSPQIEVPIETFSEIDIFEIEEIDIADYSSVAEIEDALGIKYSTKDEIDATFLQTVKKEQ